MSNPSDRTSLARASSGQRFFRLSVGYDSEWALTAALRKTPAIVVRELRALHVAEVRTTTTRRVVSTLRRAPGIRFVQRTSARVSLAEPGVTLGSMTPRAVWEWQARATHE
ncbi:MAG TPA: hypothetical protein VF321_04320, partial [Gaiellaceae bacterium]